jgi:hypothetical protein
LARDLRPCHGCALPHLGVATGRQDSSTGYRDLWQVLEHHPRATFAVLDRVGHNPQIEQRAVFEALVHEWLDRVDEAQKPVRDGQIGR